MPLALLGYAQKLRNSFLIQMLMYDTLTSKEVNAMTKNQTLKEIIDTIIEQMRSAGFSGGTCKRYQTVFNRLKRLAERKEELYYTNELGEIFISDDAHMIKENTERYHHDRTMMYIRCIRLIETYIKDGKADFTPALATAEFPLESAELRV